jgi:rfaE bifunctional protein nucleotidyltransferase chain/domain
MLDNIKEKIYTLDDLQRRVSAWRVRSHKIVFTNGCFDLLHLGHISYLADAKSLGNKLIIGLNSDESVKRLKGVSRPINDIESRAMMLASFAFVDAVCVFEEDTPLHLISTLSPDVLVKGGDYEMNQIVGHDVVLEAGGIVKTIPFLEGYSSSNIVARIKGS